MTGQPVRCLVEARRPVWLDGVLLGEPRELTAPWSGGVVHWSVVRVRVGLTTLDVATSRVRLADGSRLDAPRQGPRPREDALEAAEAVSDVPDDVQGGSEAQGGDEGLSVPVVSRRRARAPNRVHSNAVVASEETRAACSEAPQNVGD